ncbi:MAG: SMC family ATPase [Spirosomaceae bacterium]|nr:SMC family ATPase [Spirosomataceae bacterium]
MFPLKLTLQGIQSYRERQEIDFTQLTAAGIFGVFGKVGSGKSTILEAITFCLFGDTERLNNRENRSYNLMNLRSDRLSIDFEFRAGHEQQRYRFVVDGRRNSKQFHLVTLDRKAYQWMPELNDWAPIATENPAERILDLSYENFKRTVIIPQGRFQEFIELTDKHRTEMMKELFKLEKYELADRTKKLQDENNTQLAGIEGVLKGMGEVSLEQLKQVRHDLKNVRELLQAENDKLTQKRNEEKAINALKQLFDRLLETSGRWESLQPQVPVFEEQKHKLTQYETYWQAFKPLFDQQILLTKRHGEEQQKRNQKREALAQLTQKVEVNQQQINALRPRYEQRQTQLDQLNEWRTLAHIKTLENEQKVTQKRVEEGEKVITERKQKLSIRQELLRKNKEKRATLRQNLPDAQRLNEVRAWFDRKEQLQKEREALKKKANDWVEQQQEIDAQKQKFVAEKWPYAVPLNPTDNYETLTQTVENTRQQLLREADDLNARLIQLQTQRALQQHAGALREGEPCPLCGSVHHPAVLEGDDDLGKVIQSVENQQQSLRTLANQTLVAFGQKLSGWQQNWTLIETQKQQLKEKEWPAKNAEIADHERLFVWAEFDPNLRDTLDNAWKTAEALQKELKELEHEIEKEEVAMANEETEIRTKLEEGLNKLKQAIATKTGAIENANAQLKTLQKVDYETVTAEQLLQKAQQTEVELNALTKEFETLDTQLRTQTQAQSALQGELTALQNNVTGIEKEQADNHAQIAQACATHGRSEEEIKLILAQNMDISSERKAIQDFETNLQATRQALDDLLKATEGKTLDTVLYQKLIEDIEAHEKEQNRLTQEMGRLGGIEKEQSEKIEQQRGLLEQKTQLENRKNDLETMGKLFKASGFVNYVSSVYLQNLCNQANERFHRMTRQQLQLELTDTNNFQVRDLLNDGKVRALNTLSGGQKFQAALALSLALADNVHAQTQAQENFFFLDEGFGSLDKESLQTVFETLKSLRRENRIVGVISHVEDLQQEIDRYLSVQNDAERGSVVAIF